MLQFLIDIIICYAWWACFSTDIHMAADYALRFANFILYSYEAEFMQRPLGWCGSFHKSMDTVTANFN